MDTHHIEMHGGTKEIGFHAGTEEAIDFLRKNTHAAADYHSHSEEHGESSFYAKGVKYKMITKEENGKMKTEVERSHHH